MPVLRKPWLIALVTSALAIVLMVVAYRQAYQSYLPLAPVLQRHYECSTGNDSQQVFTLITSQPEQARHLPSRLCQAQDVIKQFGRVEALWLNDDAEIMQYVGKGQANLALVKKHLMAVTQASETYNYQRIASYPDYRAFFIALKEKPELSKGYLMDKSMGLVDSPTSRSGYILPLSLLNSLDLPPENMQLTYASSHDELRELLSRGEVDIISSYWKQSDEQRFSLNYATAIGDTISGSHWYLKLPQNNINLRCAIQDALSQQAAEASSSYYQQLELEGDCNAAE
ncbi:hypothetical protein HMF8227_02604 [Saliniradius amylolyticus]|uniref:Uncharacterized protein n=1 Tax=Saliniradius amylolyticus TaxID=2183582 RepID=A0A2S2E5W9_9ALTE|nr:PhnD/SsuA/transferrin family substrate-binding protein [Saliniradius amylolyticus]AWL13056.1 hypothetical protein HMF8227_02604 [Saliniradius amylolyticus]